MASRAPSHQNVCVVWEWGMMLGKGGFGDVYLGWEAGKDERHAVKAVPLGNRVTLDQCVKLLKEVGVMRALGAHPRIVDCGGALYDPRGHLCIVMEYMRGGTLRGHLRSSLKLSPKAAAKCIKQVVEGLAHLHSQRIYHRDLKCENILVSHVAASGRTPVVKIADFGNSKVKEGNFMQSLRSSLTLGGSAPTESATTVTGTALWMAPEVIKSARSCGGYSPSKADVWSLGIVSCEILNKGRTPWPAYEHPVQALFCIAQWTGGDDGRTLPPEAPEEISPACREFLSQCLSVPTEDRAEAAALLKSDFLAKAKIDPTTLADPGKGAGEGGGGSDPPASPGEHTKRFLYKVESPEHLLRLCEIGTTDRSKREVTSTLSDAFAGADSWAELSPLTLTGDTATTAPPPDNVAPPTPPVPPPSAGGPRSPLTSASGGTKTTGGTTTAGQDSHDLSAIISAPEDSTCDGVEGVSYNDPHRGMGSDSGEEGEEEYEEDEEECDEMEDDDCLYEEQNASDEWEEWEEDAEEEEEEEEEEEAAVAVAAAAPPGRRIPRDDPSLISLLSGPAADPLSANPLDDLDGLFGRGDAGGGGPPAPAPAPAHSGGGGTRHPMRQRHSWSTVPRHAATVSSTGSRRSVEAPIVPLPSTLNRRSTYCGVGGAGGHPIPRSDPLPQPAAVSPAPRSSRRVPHSLLSSGAGSGSGPGSAPTTPLSSHSGANRSLPSVVSPVGLAPASPVGTPLSAREGLRYPQSSQAGSSPAGSPLGSAGRRVPPAMCGTSRYGKRDPFSPISSSPHSSPLRDLI